MSKNKNDKWAGIKENGFRTFVKIRVGCVLLTSQLRWIVYG